MPERFGPLYFHFKHDDDWTKDHNEAVHFSRKQDAESVIEHYGWTRAKAVEHMWQEPTVREVIAESNGHHWIKAFSMTCCRDCGMVRRHDDLNKPCKGVVGVGPRDTNLYGS
jgi:hypothetical protein